jgi:hypothetical protein
VKITKIRETSTKMDATPSPRIYGLFENLSMEPWRCVAELVDNAFDDFRANSHPNGIVYVYCKDGFLYIRDNGSGMSHDVLENAIKAGYSSKEKHNELGLFGVGFNIACARLGRQATVWTKRKTDKLWLQVVIDVNNLIKNNTFKIQPSFVELEDIEEKNGTIVAVKLARHHLSNFERPAYMDVLSKELGRTYSYLLRKSVPGLSGNVAGNPRPITINVGGKTVGPMLPCIWNENRQTTYKGAIVNAVEKFRKDLPDVSVCNECGKWHSTIIQKKCEKCGSTNIQTSSRLVWGWIGIQRSMDKLNFGINFLRNGRNILFQDQNIFSFFDPTTGETFKDYPVEWPADQGRIVGEVHCDHVSVDFIKREFDVQDPYWSGVLEIVRGDSSLQPRRQRGTAPNNSPLAKIFNAFRINEPGEKYLIPGNGKRAIHEATKNWVQKFHEGDPTYYTDDEWYKATVNHDRIASGGITGSSGTVSSSPSVSPTTPISPVSPEPTTPSQTSVGGTSTGSTSSIKAKPTIKQKMVRWKSAGVKRNDLSKIVTPPSIGKSFSIECWETFSVVTDDNGKEVSVLAVPTKGNELVAFAYKNAEIFQIYGRNTTDFLLMELSNHIKTLSGSAVPVTLILSEILKEFPDEEHSEKVLRSGMSEMQERLRSKYSFVTSEHSEEVWNALSKDEKEIAENNAVGDSSVVWSKAIIAGSYGKYLGFGGMKEIVKKMPGKVFDGKLFKQHYASIHANTARQRAQGYIVKALDDLNKIFKLNNNLSSYEIRIAENSLNFINESIAIDE